MSSHTDQCNGTSVATSNSGPPTPASSTCQHVLPLGYHDVGTQSISGGLFCPEHISLHGSGAGLRIPTILPLVLTSSDPSAILPLPSPLTLPSPELPLDVPQHFCFCSSGHHSLQKSHYLKVLYTGKLAVWSLMLELLSLRRSKGWRDVGFNLCVAPFPNICVPNFKLEDSCQRCSEWSEGPKVGGLEVQKC